MDLHIKQTVANYLVLHNQVHHQSNELKQQLAQVTNFIPQEYYEQVQGNVNRKIYVTDLLINNYKNMIDIRSKQILTQSLNGKSEQYLTYYGYLNLIRVKGNRVSEHNKTLSYRDSLQKLSLYHKNISNKNKEKVKCIISKLVELKLLQIKVETKLVSEAYKYKQALKLSNTSTVQNIVNHFVNSQQQMNNFISKYSKYTSSFPHYNLSANNSLAISKYITINKLQQPSTLPYQKIPKKSYIPPSLSQRTLPKNNTIFETWKSARKTSPQTQYLIRFMSPECTAVNMGKSTKYSTQSSETAFQQYNPQWTISKFRTQPTKKRIFNHKYKRNFN